MVSSGKRWSFVDRYGIPNDINDLYSKDIVMSQYVSEIKCIHDSADKSSLFGVGSVDLGTVDPSAAQRSLSSCRQ